MLLRLIGLYLTLSCLFAQNVIASAPNFEVMLEDTAAGEIKAIYQDRAGFMWFGGRNSLLRYDAYKYKNIQALEQKGGELKKVSPYIVTSIYQDSQDRIWIVSLSGLYIFDPDKEILIRPVPAEGKLDPYFLSPLQDLKELPSGDFIVGGDGVGVAIFDKKTLAVRWRQIQAQQEPDSAVSKSERTVQKILIDTKSRIWITNNLGLNLFDLDTKKFTLFIPSPETPNSKDYNSIITLVEDRQGNLLGGTWGGGLYVFDTQSHQFKRFKNDPKNPNSLPEDAIWQVLIDSENRIWLGMSRAGVALYNPETETFTRFAFDYGQPGSPAYGAVLTLYEDRNKNIWAGHYPAKVSFHDLSSEAITVYRKNPERPETILDSDVLAVMEDKDNNLWLGVGTGVDFLDRKAEKFKHYNASLGNYPARGTLSGFIDRQQVPWLGTWSEGFYRLNKALDKFEAMPIDASLATASEKQSTKLNDSIIWGFCQPKDNSFWMGTHYAGISRYDATTGIFTKYKNNNSAQSLADNIAWNCFEDSKGRFWIGTANGLSLMDRDRESFKNYMPSDDNPHALKSGSVLDIYEDKRGRLWFATNGGLHLYREESDDFESYTTENGFANNGIRALTGDLAGNLWLGTNDGIIQFNPDSKKVKNYLVFGGKKCGAVNTGAALTSGVGEVLFGTTDGLIVIDAQKLTTNQMPPPVALTDFKIFARSVLAEDSDSPLTKAVDKTSLITLDYTKRMFSFEFAALNYRSAYKNRYAYKLEGFDQDWREIGTAREAQYTNINPGEYEFKVRASNNDDVWSSSPRTITVVQLPPPWKTWWAYTIYALLMLSTIVYYIYLQKRKQQLVEEQNKLLEIKVAERTRDLDQKNKDIQSLLSNMRQGLFTIEDGGVIHHEYSAFLESIFETQSIAGRDALNLLFEHASLSEDNVSQVEASVHSTIGEDEMNYELNAHLLIREYQIELNRRTKILSLDWNPILDGDDNVAKLMVSVRDVTELKALEIEAGIKKRELDMVAQLLGVSIKKFNHYWESASRYIDESRHLVEQCDAFDASIMGKLFRNMHTLKGNSRALGFTYAANAAHDAESFFDQVSQVDVALAKNSLIEGLEAVATAIREYNQVFTQVLGRDGNALGDGSGVWMSKTSIEVLKCSAESIKQKDPYSYQSILGVINTSCSAPIADVISSTIDSLPAMAVELGKKLPQLVINDQGLLIKESAHNLLRDVFTHLLRNSIDHGLEDANTRVALNKDPAGTITITLDRRNENLFIQVTDDGRGLNLNHLHQKAVENGLLSTAAAPTCLEVANMIFAAGVSTKQNLDTISGRGVGMDAVRHFLIEFGGDIEIILAGSEKTFVQASELESVNFALCLKLPADKTLIDAA